MDKKDPFLENARIAMKASIDLEDRQLQKQTMALFLQRLERAGSPVTEIFQLNERDCVSRHKSKMHAHRRPVEDGALTVQPEGVGLLDVAYPTAYFDVTDKTKGREFSRTDIENAIQELRSWFPEIEVRSHWDPEQKIFSYTAKLERKEGP